MRSASTDASRAIRAPGWEWVESCRASRKTTLGSSAQTQLAGRGGFEPPNFLIQSQAPYQLGHRPAAAKRSIILATPFAGPAGETAGRARGTFPQTFPQLGISSLATMESVPSPAPKPEQLLAIARA